MSKKDALRQAFNTDKQPSNRTAEPVASTPEFTPIEPMSLSTARREPAQTTNQVKRAYNAAKLPKAKRGVIRTKRVSFEITPELHAEMLQTLAKHLADTGQKVNASEFIRKAIAREIREFKR